MNITYKFRLYPSKKQEEKLLWTLEKCRFTYNKLLEGLNKQEKINRNELQHSILELKEENPELNNIYSKTLQYEHYRLFYNLKTLSRLKKNGKKVGRLRFKGEGRFKTFTYNQSGFKLIQSGKKCQILSLSKIGEIPIRCHRDIKGKIKQITIKKESSGKWFASIIAEQKITIPKKPINKVIGIDLGLTDIVYDSEDNKVENPRYLEKYANKLALLQRKLFKKKIGGKNRNKVRIRVTKQYEKLVNARNDFLHKLSRYYVDNYDAVGLENLTITNMVKNKYLAKSIHDASWNKFKQFIAYKAERAGKYYITVNYKGTTQRCSQCRNIVNKILSKRLHKCSFCGFKVLRDYNSALNIKRLTLKEIGQELSEFKPVEIALAAELMHLRSTSHQSKKQEALCTNQE